MCAGVCICSSVLCLDFLIILLCLGHFWLSTFGQWVCSSQPITAQGVRTGLCKNWACWVVRDGLTLNVVSTNRNWQILLILPLLWIALFNTLSQRSHCSIVTLCTVLENDHKHPLQFLMWDKKNNMLQQQESCRQTHLDWGCKMLAGYPLIRPLSFSLIPPVGDFNLGRIIIQFWIHQFAINAAIIRNFFRNYRIF